MVSNKIGYPVDLILIKPKVLQHFLCLCRTFLLLQFAVTSAKFSLRRADSNIMYISCRFQNIEQLIIQVLFLPDQLSKLCTYIKCWILAGSSL